MKTIITSISLLICLMLLSCENDLDLRDVNEMEPQVTVEKKVENGRFVFTNKELLRDYTHYELDFFGMARRGNTWKGNRMIR